MSWTGSTALSPRDRPRGTHMIGTATIALSGAAAVGDTWTLSLINPATGAVTKYAYAVVASDSLQIVAQRLFAQV